jgi:phospholipid/cholesterol/gamma-HCH transport system substrate-binding protein
MEASKGIEYKVGIFVAISIFLTLAFIIALGGDKAVLHRSITLKIKADTTGGLSPGSVVQLSGINCGNVSGTEFDPESTKVIIILKVDRKFQERIPENSTATLQTQDVDKMTATLNQKNFAGNLASSSQSLQEIMASIKTNDVRNNKIKKSMDHVASILEKIDNGQGTLGGLINDPTVHEDLKAILGGAKRSTILKYLIRQAVKGSEEEEQEKKNPSNKK